MAENAESARALPAATALGLVVRLPNGVVIPVSDAPANNSDVTFPGLTGADQNLLAASATHLGGYVQNISANVLFVKLGAGAAVNSFTYRLEPFEGCAIPASWQGVVHGISSAAGGNAAVTRIRT